MKIRRHLSLLIFSLVILAFSASSFADGCFFGYKDLEEPSQVGVIVTGRGEEDLILFVNAQTDAEDFAWVVPVPSYPTVKEAKSSLFYDLSYITTYHPHPSPFTCGTGNIVFAPGGEDVHVWETIDVGIYETTILSSENSRALINWLNQNGYTFPKDAQDVIDYYIQKKYFFIAMKVKKNENETFGYYMGINPIHIHFATDKTIYPLKISSISAAPVVEVLLYIFDKKPRTYPGFDIEYSEYLKPNEYEDYPTLNELLKGESFYLTKLRAHLTPEEMTEDMVFSDCRTKEASIINAPIAQLFVIGIFGIISRYIFK